MRLLCVVCGSLFVECVLAGVCSLFAVCWLVGVWLLVVGCRLVVVCLFVWLLFVVCCSCVVSGSLCRVCCLSYVVGCMHVV